MVAPFSPIQALSGELATLEPQCREFQAEIEQVFLAELREVVIAFGRYEPTQLNH